MNRQKSYNTSTHKADNYSRINTVMKNMLIKNLLILIILLTVSVTSTVLLKVDTSTFIDTKKPEWDYKQKEIIDRLLAVPILLYHNIDGRGPFSISQRTLRDHFELMKKHAVTVIPLQELVRRLENPLPFDKKVAVITFDDGFLSMYTKLLPLVKEYGYPVTLFVYTDTIKITATRSLTWNMLQEMGKHGIDIQSHSKEHSDLTKLSVRSDTKSRQKLYTEIYQSKRLLELYLDKKIDFFAFPYGRYNLELIDLAYQSGYLRVFSTDYGSNIVTRNNYCLKRHHIKSEYTQDYIKKLLLVVF